MDEESTPHCVNHVMRLAVESCEICSDPLCGFCLYYTADGRRLCRQHARELEAAGEVIYTPGHYVEDIPRSQMGAARAADMAGAADAAPYRGNTTDVLALVSAASMLIGLLSCFIPCMPLVMGLVGLAAVLNAKQAVDPTRTRWLGAVGAGVLLFYMCAVIFVCLYLAGSAQVFTMSGPSVVLTVQPAMPTPVVTPEPPRTF